MIAVSINLPMPGATAFEYRAAITQAISDAYLRGDSIGAHALGGLLAVVNMPKGYFGFANHKESSK